MYCQACNMPNGTVNETFLASCAKIYNLSKTTSDGENSQKPLKNLSKTSQKPINLLTLSDPGYWILVIPRGGVLRTHSYI